MNESPLSSELAPVVLVPEIRDYDKINAELIRLLDEGCRRVRLVGVEGQRLLARGLQGGWNAVVDIEGNAGPEIGAGNDAPSLAIVVRGSAADGAGRDLRSGRLVVLGDASDAVGYSQSGGVIVIVGNSGHRAGLAMAGGVQVHLGTVGRLAGDRQSGGTLIVRAGHLGPYAGRGQRGGRIIQMVTNDDATQAESAEDSAGLREALSDLDVLDLGPEYVDAVSRIGPRS